jgi:hypothetical protein
MYTLKELHYTLKKVLPTALKGISGCSGQKMCDG